MASAFTLKDLSGTTLFDVDDSGNLTMTGDLALVDITLTGNATIGDSSADVVDINATIKSDYVLTGAITMSDVTGGATDGALSLQLKDLSNTNITSARRVMIVANATEYGPNSPSSTVTFAAATAGSLVDSGNGWAVVDTSAAGAFACTASNSADETVYFRVSPALVNSSAAKLVIACQADATAVAWSS